MLKLINDVLDISKIDADKLQPDQHPFAARESIEKCLAMIFPLAEQKGLRLESSIASDVGEIISDQRRVEQIIINLLNNAVKFTKSGSVKLVAEIVSAEKSKNLRLQVIDTGIGIKPEDIEKLFHPFQQLPSGTTGSHEGTGLGLSICRKLSTLLGGDITVTSEYGKGSSFEVKIPIDIQTAV